MQPKCCRHPLALAVLLSVVVVAVGASQPPTGSSSRKAAAQQQVRQPLWLQQAAQRSSKQPATQPVSSSRPPAPRDRPQSSILTAPYILLKRAHTVRHRHRVSSSSNTTIRLSSHGIRAGSLFRVPLNGTGDAANVTIRVPEDNDYTAVGVFAWDLGAATNVDLSLSLGQELVSESSNPAGMDDVLEAPEGLMPGDYVVTVKGVEVPKAITVQVYVWMFTDQRRAVIATALPIQASPNPVQLTGVPGCCSVELAVGDIQLANSPVSRYIGIIKYTQPDGTPIPGAPSTMVYLL